MSRIGGAMSPSARIPVVIWYRSGWNRWWLLRSMTVTSTSARRSDWAANNPPKPQPTITTRWRWLARPWVPLMRALHKARRGRIYWTMVLVGVTRWRRGETSALRRWLQPQAGGHGHEVGQGVGLHLEHHLAAVRLDGDLTDAELAGDLFVQPPGNDECHDLAFAWRERLVAVPHFTRLRVASQGRETARERIANGAHQRIVP